MAYKFMAPLLERNGVFGVKYYMSKVKLYVSLSAATLFLSNLFSGNNWKNIQKFLMLFIIANTKLRITSTQRGSTVHTDTTQMPW